MTKNKIGKYGLFQKSIKIFPGTSAADLALKIHRLEHEFYPKIIEGFIKNLQDK